MLQANILKKEMVQENTGDMTEKEMEHLSSPVHEYEIKDPDITINKQIEDLGSPELENKMELENSDNISNKQIEHMRSVKVVLERIKYYDCKKCSCIFLHPQKLTLHMVSHVKPTVSSNIDEDRFVKRFKCSECGAKFVQISTLEEHAIIHQPFPHVCSCGIGYYLKKDLSAHKNLVHSDEINKQTANMTFLKKRALKNDMWIPQINYKGRKKKSKLEPDYEIEIKEEIKEENSTSSVRPRVQAQLVVKTKSKTPKNRLNIQKPEFKDDNIEISQDISTKRFKCPLCPKTFQAKQGVIIHQVIHTGEKRFPCNLCGKRFTQVGALNKHLKRHTGVKDYSCSYCGKMFFDLGNLMIHTRTHTGERPYACKFCKKTFSDYSAHLRHERIHTGVKPYACKYCHKTFSDASAQIRHVKVHENNKPYKCEHCFKRWYTKSDLKKHMHSVHGFEKNFVCKPCNKSFALKIYLDRHLLSHKSGRKYYECDYCGSRAPYKCILAKHIQVSHLQIRNYVCDICGLDFTSKLVLENHHNAVHMRSVKYECNDCGAKYPVKSYLWKHIVTKHVVGATCNICKKIFSNSADLQIHNSKGCLQCEICDRYYMTPDTLKSHMLVHTKKTVDESEQCLRKRTLKMRLNNYKLSFHNKYECDECGECFNLKSMLRKHILSIHLIMVMCNMCHKMFYSGSDLDVHKSKGDCNQKVVCEICGNYYKKDYFESYHKHVHSNNRKMLCAHCPKRFLVKSEVLRHIRICHKHVFQKTIKKNIKNKF